MAVKVEFPSDTNLAHFREEAKNLGIPVWETDEPGILLVEDMIEARLLAGELSGVVTEDEE